MYINHLLTLARIPDDKTEHLPHILKQRISVLLSSKHNLSPLDLKHHVSIIYKEIKEYAILRAMISPVIDIDPDIIDSMLEEGIELYGKLMRSKNSSIKLLISCYEGQTGIRIVNGPVTEEIKKGIKERETIVIMSN